MREHTQSSDGPAVALPPLYTLAELLPVTQGRGCSCTPQHHRRCSRTSASQHNTLQAQHTPGAAGQPPTAHIHHCNHTHTTHWMTYTKAVPVSRRQSSFVLSQRAGGAEQGCAAETHSCQRQRGQASMHRAQQQPLRPAVKRVR